MKLNKITLLAILVLLLSSSVGCGQAGTMIITGKVSLASYGGGEPSANVQPGEPATNTEVKLYTYKKPELVQLPPIGDFIAITVTDEQGKYRFEVQLKKLPQGCDKLVVFVDGGTKGYRVINVAPGTMQVDLIKASVALPSTRIGKVPLLVTGKVTLAETGHPLSGVEVKLYTYKKPDLPQLPPTGDLIATATTEITGGPKSAKYLFEVQLEALPQGCDKLVVFVDSGTKGYRVIEATPGTIQVDLMKGSPALLIAMTITGVVTYRGSGAPAGGVRVELYTYDPSSPFENFPCGPEIKEAPPADKEGKYQLEVSEYEFRELTQLGHDKLVVFVGAASGGWEIVDLHRGTIEVDLVMGAPAPCG